MSQALIAEICFQQKIHNIPGKNEKIAGKTATAICWQQKLMPVVCSK